MFFGGQKMSFEPHYVNIYIIYFIILYLLFIIGVSLYKRLLTIIS